jgi:hypothetical protein
VKERPHMSVRNCINLIACQKAQGQGLTCFKPMLAAMMAAVERLG